MLVYILSDVYNVNYRYQSKRISSNETNRNKQLTMFDYGFYWCWNFCQEKKWRNSQISEEKYQDLVLADFRTFCDNHDNRLIHFWDEINDMANQKLTKNKQESSKDS